MKPLYWFLNIGKGANMKLSDEQKEALRLLDISEEEYTNKYRKPQAELEVLRLGVKNIAEMTKSKDVTSFIPKNVKVARGWNRLCAVIVDYLEGLNRR